MLSCMGCNYHLSQMEICLESAEDNRKELERVIDHYKNDTDTLKYKAACFLIENMLGHYWKQSKASNCYWESVNSMSCRMPVDSLNTIWTHLCKVHSNEIYIQEDIKNITAEYLIENIDESFNAWRSLPWGNKVNFQTFCQYVLPYRLYNEKIGKCWRRDFRLQYVDLIKDVSDINVAFAKIYNAINDSMRGSSTHCPYNLDPLSIAKAKGASCEKRSIVIGAVLRSFCIPVSFDYANGFANYSNVGMHAWVSGMMNDKLPMTVFGRDSIARIGNPIDATFFWKIDECPTNYPIQDYPRKKIVKIYRYEYKMNDDSLHVKDVSSTYGLNGKLSLNVGPDAKQVHLFTFHCGLGWKKEMSMTPNYGKCEFEHIGKDIVYLVQIQTDKSSYYFDSPILLLNNNTQRILKPVPSNRKVFLYRKYPWLTLWSNRWHTMKGSKFEVSNDSSFRNSKTIFTISEMPWIKNEVALKNKGAFRYFRFNPSKLNKRNADSLVFYNGLGELSKSSMADIRIYSHGKLLNGRVIYDKIDEKSAKHAFDGDNNTVCTHGTLDYWVGLELSSPKKIDKIIYFPRNDDNFIRQDDLYELFYWDSSKWTSLGQRIGEEDGKPLEYDNIPYNALFLLKNLSRGKEEAVFTYDNGKQTFW